MSREFFAQIHSLIKIKILQHTNNNNNFLFIYTTPIFQKQIYYCTVYIKFNFKSKFGHCKRIHKTKMPRLTSAAFPVLKSDSNLEFFNF